MQNNNLTHKIYLNIMIPFMLSTVTQPLLGAADIAVVGRLGDEKYIAGISIGTLIFNTIYWIFGFLRVSTTGFSAQSIKNSDIQKTSDTFFRPLFIAVFISILFIIFQNSIFNFSMELIIPDIEIKKAASEYFFILIWGAPFVLINYVILGWLMGQGNIKGSLTMQISSNLLNIILDVILVVIFKQKIAGVAYATLISQIVSTLIGLYYLLPYGYTKNLCLKNIFKKKELISIMCVNKDLMLRTVCLVVHNNLFTAASSSLGVTILSANAVLFQVLSVISYLLDGIANTSSVFAGRAAGEKNNILMKNTWKKTFQWGLIMAGILTIIYLILYPRIIGIFTDITTIIHTAERYAYWIALYPILAFIGLTFYGVFTGSSVTAPILYSTAGALAGFLLSWKYVIPILNNDGIWISLLLFYFLRSILLIPFLKKTLN